MLYSLRPTKSTRASGKASVLFLGSAGLVGSDNFMSLVDSSSNYKYRKFVGIYGETGLTYLSGPHAKNSVKPWFSMNIDEPQSSETEPSQRSGLELAVKGKKLKLIQKEFLKEKFWNKSAQPGVHKCIMVLDHLKPDFNVGKIFRSGDAFGVHEIWLVGIPIFHPGPAMGSFRHVPARFFPDFKECHKELVKEGYCGYVFEPTGGSPLYRVEFPQKSAFIMGHEEYGVSFKKEDYSEIKAITVPQFGKVQSLNVSIAASIALYEYVRQLNDRQ